jgi:hypothetical protein
MDDVEPLRARNGLLTLTSLASAAVADGPSMLAWCSWPL